MMNKETDKKKKTEKVDLEALKASKKAKAKAKTEQQTVEKNG